MMKWSRTSLWKNCNTKKALKGRLKWGASPPLTPIPDKQMIEEESQEYMSNYFAEKDSEVAKLKKIELDAQEKLLHI
mgnify:CR=1 FL=1